MKKSLLISLFAVLTVQLLSGCATRVAVPLQTRAYYDEIKTQMVKENVAVVTDGCFGWSEIGTSHYVRDVSENLGKGLSVNATEFLTKAGLKVASSNTPLVCGMLSEKVLKEYTIKQNNDSDRVEIKDHPILNSTYTNKANGKHYSDLYNAVLRSPITNDFQTEAKVAPTKLDISDEAAKALFEDTKSNYVWINTVLGGKTSFARKFGVAVLTAAVTAGASGGVSATSVMIQDGVGYRLALVKLDTKEVLWNKVTYSHGIDPTNKDIASPNTTKYLMTPFYALEPVVAK